ncbi:MAG: IclR family transcriptional regulator [Rhizobiales bacterium]|nr:IclR family transcriptional regulator [Hyphomicrobiales bacterium]
MEPLGRRMRGRPRLTDLSAKGGSVQSLERAIAILRAVADSDGLSLTEVARLTAVSSSTAYRMLTTLQHHRLAEFEEATQLWFVGVESFRIGSAFQRRRKLAEHGRSILQQLLAQTGETANIAVADRDGVVFVTQAETHQPIRAFFRPGTRGAYHASGIGKAVLAFLNDAQRSQTLQRLELERFTSKTLCTVTDLAEDLDRIRSRAYALDNEERHIGMRCIAAPVFDEFVAPIGGLSVSGPSVRVNDLFVERFAMTIVAAARELTRAVGGIEPAQFNPGTC